MKIVRRIGLLFILLMTLSIVASGLAIWSFQTANTHVTKVSLAYQVHASILSLKSNTYQLFKQFGDAMIIGDLDRGKGEAELITKVRADIRTARALIGKEFELQGEEEIDELEHLAKIELMVENLISKLETTRRSATQAGDEASWVELRRLLDEDIDEDFHALLSEALEEEQREVAETLEEAAEEAALYQWVAIGFALLAIGLTVASFLILSHSVAHPVKALLEGIRAFTEGDRMRRVAVTGANELREVADTFNVMADQISTQTSILSSENEALERAVGQRTEQLETLIGNLKQADETRRRMLADVSHELRTPLTIIQGEAEIALRGDTKPAEVYREALTKARDAAIHTSHLIDDLLFVARSEAGHAKLNITQIDMVDTAEGVLAMFAGNAEFITDVDTAPMRGDAPRLQQALMTLLENARHHGGRAIVLRISRSPDGHRVAVEDDGPGMTDDEKNKAFKRFFRGSNAAGQYKNGLGLGLPIAQSIAKAHGGDIELTDRPGGGLIAAMILPSRPSLRAVA